jgi:hypothetical protein
MLPYHYSNERGNASQLFGRSCSHSCSGMTSRLFAPNYRLLVTGGFFSCRFRLQCDKSLIDDSHGCRLVSRSYLSYYGYPNSYLT